MKYFPLFHRIEQKPCLVIGGGQVALRRVQALVAAGACIDVIAPQICPAIKDLVTQSSGTVLEQCVDIALLETHYLCIVAATDQRDVNAALTDFAHRHRIPVNVAARQDDCDFIFPAIIDRQPLTVAVSNNGCAPVLSRLLKQQIDAYIPAAYGQLAQFVGEHRQQVKSVIADSPARKNFWEHALQGAIAEAIYSGKAHQAEQLLQQALASSGEFLEETE